MKVTRHICIVLTALTVILALPCRTAGAGKKGTAAPQTLPGARTEIYKNINGVKLPIHIFEPDAKKFSGARPAIVFFFGGGWNSGSPAQFEKHCAYLAGRGMVAMTVEYRVANRHGVKAVSCFSDAKSAIRWVRQNAKRLNVDPDRIAAGGGSAGGHLAGALGTVQKFDERTEDSSVSAVPNALVLYNPALVLAPVEGRKALRPDKLATLEARTGVPPVQLSPYHNLRPDLPPTIIFHGRADTTVPYDSSLMFTEKAKKLGCRIELAGYDDAGHGFFNFGRFQNRYFIETLKKTDAFLVSLGYLKGENQVDDFVKK